MRPVSRRTFLKTKGAVFAFPAILRAQAGAPSTQQPKLDMEIKRIGSEPSLKVQPNVLPVMDALTLYSNDLIRRTPSTAVSRLSPALEPLGIPTRDRLNGYTHSYDFAEAADAGIEKATGLERFN